jgi:hypothetical protein
MFMRDNDAIQIFRTQTDGFKSLGDLSGTKSGVNKKSAPACGN